MAATRSAKPSTPAAGDGRLTRRVGVTDAKAEPLYAFATDRHAVLTGPILGSVELADGTVVDVSAPVIAVDTAEQAVEVSHLIGLRYEDEGHPNHAPTEIDPHPEPFVHLCTPGGCGPHARAASDPMQAMALARAEKVMRATSEADLQLGHAFGQAMGLIDPGTPPPTVAALASAAAENAALNGLDGTGSTNVIPVVALHTATPGTTGTSENANTGSYARQTCTWNAAASGSKTNSTALTFATSGSVAVTHVGTWSTATYAAGTYAIGAALTSSVTAASISIASGALSFSAA